MTKRFVRSLLYPMICLVLVLLYVRILAPNACSQSGVILPFDPIDYDSSVQQINKPVESTVIIDLEVHGPDGRVVKDFWYSIEFVVPGRLGQEVGTSGRSRSGRLQYTQPGATAAYINVEKDGFYAFDSGKLTGGEIDETARTMAYREPLVLTPVDTTLPKLWRKDGLDLRTDFVWDSEGLILERTDILAAVMTIDQAGLLSVTSDTITSPVLPTIDRSFLYLDLIRDDSFVGVIKDGNVISPPSYRRVLRLVSVQDSDGLFPSVQYLYGGEHNGRPFGIYVSDYSPVDRSWSAYSCLTNSMRAAPRVELTRSGRLGEAPSFGYMHLVTLPHEALSTNPSFVSYLRVREIYGKIFMARVYFDLAKSNPPSLGDEIWTLSTKVDYYLNQTGSTDVRSAPDPETDGGF